MRDFRLAALLPSRTWPQPSRFSHPKRRSILPGRWRTSAAAGCFRPRFEFLSWKPWDESPVMKALTAAEMREVDRLTTERFGIPGHQLMEAAGTSVAAAAHRACKKANRAQRG